MFNRFKAATAVAVIFHLVGLIGILFFDRDLFISLTPYNLLLSFCLIVWTQQEKSKSFFLFLAIVFITGFFAEWIGTSSQLLFGHYSYGNVLGPKWQSVPLIIGINWIIVIYCCGISVIMLSNKIVDSVKENITFSDRAGHFMIAFDGALLATFFDWVIEPVAVKLDYWKWLNDNGIPFKNYLTWFMVSFLLILLMQEMKTGGRNQFAVNLLLIQFMFFLVLRTFL